MRWSSILSIPKYFSPFLKIQVLVAPEENFIILVLQQPELAWTMIVHKYICHHGRESLFLNESLSVMIVKQIYGKSILCAPLREGLKNPSRGIFPLGGSPPPLYGRENLAKKVNGKGGYPPNSGRISKKIRQKNIFCIKKTVFRPIFNKKKVNGKGGYPPSPHSGRIFPKN